MKYISLTQLREALDRLRPHHPFFGVTFWVMKKERAPVGKKIRFQLDSLNDDFLKQHYRVHPKSNYLFRVLRKGTSISKHWNKPNYASTGLQAINTQTFRDALLHDRNDNTWGWSSDYINVLKEHLPKGQKFPLFHFAAWIYRTNHWADETKREELVDKIIAEYGLSQQELNNLFDTTVSSSISNETAFQDTPVKWHEILKGYSSPDDVPPESSGVLTYLEVESVGPLRHLCFEPSRRLNIITGDNGLGKTFILDLAWWALTRYWVEHPAWPASPNKRIASIKYSVSATAQSKPQKANWDPTVMRWHPPKKSTSVSGLVIYARVDGSFAVWDPVNRFLRGSDGHDTWKGDKFTREEVWNGTDRIEGLVRDWVKWQEQEKHAPTYETFSRVLERVSPPDLGPLRAGDPQRIPGDRRDIPTLVHPYGTVPIIFASAGIKRILTIAYLIVWAWEEHKVQALHAGKREERQMVVLIDEVEAHLHPRWQRVILPALMGIASDLSPELSMQLLVGTHSPLVLASSEPVFDDEMDRLFHLELMANGRIEMAQLPFDLRGSIDSWLASDVFKLQYPGSQQREEAIRSAIRLQHADKVTRDDVESVTKQLRDNLPAEDPFWPRWVFFAESHGVQL